MSKKSIGTLDDILDSFLEVFDTFADGLEESIEKIIEDGSDGEINVDEISEVVAKSLSTMGVTLKTGESIQAQDISTMINPLIDEVTKQFQKATNMETAMKDGSMDDDIEKRLEEIVPAITNAAMILVEKATSKFNINMKDIIAQVYEGIEEEK